MSNEAGSGATAGQDELARRDRLVRLAGFEPYVRRRGTSTGAGRLSSEEEALLELDEDEEDEADDAGPWRKARSEKARSGTVGSTTVSHIP